MLILQMFTVLPDISWTCPGIVPDISWTFPGILPDISLDFHGKFRYISRQLPGHSGKCHGHFPDLFRKSRKCPGHFPELSWIFPGNVLDMSLTFPGFSSLFPEQFPKPVGLFSSDSMSNTLIKQNRCSQASRHPTLPPELPSSDPPPSPPLL